MIPSINRISKLSRGPLKHFARSLAEGSKSRHSNGRAILEALLEIKSWQAYAPTPMLSLEDISAALGLGEVLYKHEGPRFGLGSFKGLGGAYAVARAVQRQLSRQYEREVSLKDIEDGLYAEAVARIVVVSATDGNHGRSVAWGAQRIGAACRIYIHADVSEFREQAIAAYGAKVIRVAGDYDDAVAQTRDDAAREGLLIVSDTTWPGYEIVPKDVMAGYGIMIAELRGSMRRAPSHIFLQGGVGSFAAAIILACQHFWPKAKIRFVIVEPLRAPCLFESSRAGRAVKAAVEDESIMAGLSCGEASPQAWDILKDTAQDYLLIPDNVIPETIRLLAGSSTGIEAGESGIAGLAALICAAANDEVRAKLNLDQSARVLLIGTEGITDPDIFARIMAGEI